MQKLLLLFLVLLAVMPAAAQEIETFEVPMNPRGYNIDVSPDGRIAAVYENNVLLADLPDLLTVPIRLIDLETGEQIGFLAGQSDFAVDVAFTPDGTSAASFHTNGDLHLWDIETQDRLLTFETLLLGGGRIQFLDDGRTLVVLTGGLNSRLLFFDTETGAITRILGRRFAQFNDFRENYTTAPASFDLTYSAFAVSPNGTIAAVATANDEVILFNVETGRPTTIREPSERFGQFSIRRMEFSEDGSQLIYFVQGEPGRVHIWDIEAEEEVFGEETGSPLWDYHAGVLAWADRDDNRLYAMRLQNLDVLLDQVLDRRITPLVTVVVTPDALIVGGLQSETEENVLLKVELETDS